NIQNPTPVPTIIPIQGIDSQVVPSDPVALQSTPVAQPTQSSVSATGIVDWLSRNLVLILVIIGGNCLLLVVIMLLVRQKGAK
ncbi:MAG: hypothetical protein Q7U31_02025, partial [Anaerolineaceae bacterium]|nr:hypothetical protein [Anaerolineaceae bacterium]